ncbi:MAG: branched-chain amino acid ABC transporter permease [Alphaproteobacteria bacterium]|nr:MAG: branched-chain amino acid ABC transporter permease [Alphaproteobacteria bacterium]
MGQWIIAYTPLVDLFLLHLGFAYAQYIVLRAGVFSLATAGLAGIGAYTAGVLAVKLGAHPALGVAAATLAGSGAALVLSLPLARLRGVYQAIATVAFVQIVYSVNLWAEPVTGGAMGLNNIPRTAGTGVLAVAALGTLYLVWAMERTRLGRAFNAIRQDEAMAATLGVDIVRHQALAFALSGAIAGLFGALEAYHAYALDPGQFAFPFLIAILSYVILGGRNSVAGPLIGTAILIILPELARPLAENRMLIYGVMLILVINFLPRGIADSLILAWRARRLARPEPAAGEP